MILTAKGDILEGAKHNKRKILEEFKKALSTPPPAKTAGHEKRLNSVEDDGTTVSIPGGGWTILDCLVREILEYIPGPIVEIGMGESTEILANHAQRHERKLYSCDLKMGGRFDSFSEPLFEGHECFIGKSEDFIKEFDDFPSVVFIDGEHTEKTVEMEVKFFLPLLLQWGVMFLHDTFPHKEKLIEDGKAGDVYKVRQALERNPNVDVFTWPYTANSCGLTMVMKHELNEERDYWKKNGRIQTEIGW